MTLNGWHRLEIVIAAAWAFAVIGLASLEHHAGQGQLRDGFFTCWDPGGGSRRPEALYWNRDCGLFPRARVQTELDWLFDDIPHVGNSHDRRYLNIPRFLAILLGPVILIGLVSLAVCWIVRGFRSSNSETDHSEPNAACKPLLSAQPEQLSQSHTEAWLHRLPQRWARNAAIGGGALAALSTVQFLSRADGAFAGFMLAGSAVVTLSSAGAGYLCGRWARHSLKAPFMVNPTSSITRITSNWTTGAILLGVLVFACDVLLGWRKTTPLLEGGVSFRDWGYLIGFFGTWTLGGYLTALVSRRGLRKAIDADRNAAPPRTIAPPASDGTSRQREYSVG